MRSQNKEKLLKVNNIEVQHHYSYKNTQEKFLLSNESFEWRNVQKKDKYIKSVIFGNDEIKLGEYTTKERALEVLDEIQSILKPKCIDFNKLSKEERKQLINIFSITPADSSINELSTYVYEMPQE